MPEFLLLGPVLFEAFELPERIGFGGGQRLAVHVLAGGARVVDALGADDGDVGWSGVFSGPLAAERARLLDLMRAEGAVWTLTWDAFAYAVVIAQFTASYEHVNWVPYKLSCLVVQDLSRPFLPADPDLATGIIADLAAVTAVATTAATAAMAAAGAISPGTAAYAGALAAVGGVAALATAGVAGSGSALLAAQDPATAATAAGQLALYADARAYAGRALANLSNAGT